MLRTGLVALLVGPAAAALTDECMKGLHELEGGSDMELSLRCRAAFGLDACRHARQSLGAQPWSHARMESSCKQFAATYEGLDARTLEAAVATKTSTDGAVEAKVAQQAPPVAPAPVQQPEEHEGPIAGLLAKLEEKKEEAEAKAEAAKGEDGEQQEGPLAGIINKMKEAKAAHEAQAKQDAAADGDNEAPRGPLADLISKMKEAKAEHEKNTAEVESDQQGPLADMFKQGEKPPVLKLYTDRQVEEPAATSGMRQVLGAFAGMVSCAAVALFIAARRAAPMGHEQLSEQSSEQLDAEQNVE